MKSLLSQISDTALKLKDIEFTISQVDNQWLGNEPSSESGISEVEKRLNVEFPSDYKDFLLISNGFAAPNDVEPTFLPIERVDYLKNIDNELIEIWTRDGISETGEELKRSILIGGIDEEQYFLIIPPDSKNQKWRYWKFASWIPGEEEYKSLYNYFEDVSDFLNQQMVTN
ncbi:MULTISPECIES: SMI1/KNR4 family protein [Flagellimonas]|jgi:cell wall assembly regulator SMI1|uniref:SMI1/KNR4 family protein n=1 Tax=Flagellimonas sp. MMG031 TaxID=3158549 RepID=A0AAU7MYI5_9FLAO|nr:MULTISPECIES: SMI1/KNR4 family protein [Allomuricauda]USD26153.1 SMI1/KNR4 family protein [Allomuricauda aquimarina]